MPGVWGWIDPVLILLSIVALILAFFNFASFKRVIVGHPMRSRELHSSHNKLYWVIALAILAADLYSSVAYGPQSGITELAALGESARWLILPITGATVILLTILIVSYMMGVSAYPNGGGAYAIAKDNFKSPLMSLTAASALLIDYVLTVAVSVAAGVQTIATQYPALVPYETVLSIVCIAIMLLVNLRGVSESATIFAWPTFLFIGAMLTLIGAGFWDELRHGFVQPVTPPFGTPPHALTTLLILKAFSSASSAVTGLETISNSVPIFRNPAQKGALKAYFALGTITGITLLGFAYHLYVKGIPVLPDKMMLVQLTTLYFGNGFLTQTITWSTFIILILAANSTFTGFPQLAALVAGDAYLPRALTLRGDRLGYSNGMIVLAGFSALLIEVFKAQTNALIPLYAIGVFVAFTVAQFGLTRRWFRVKGSHWKTKATINSVGAIVTALVAVVFASTKFTSGAWIVLIVLPSLIVVAVMIHRHYEQIANELRINFQDMRPSSHKVISIVLISGVNQVVLKAISFAQSIHREGELIALFVGFNDDSIAKMEQKWKDWGEPCRLVTIKSEYRSLISPVNRFLQRVENWEGGKPDHVHVMIAQFIPKRWWHNILHNQTSFLLRTWLLRTKDVVVTTLPYHLQD